MFQCFRRASLTLKPKKCHLFQKEVEYLGHLISERGITCSQKKIKAVEDWPIPRDKTEVRSFLGLLNYYRRFIPDFATVAFPLTKLTQKKIKFSWNEKCQYSFERLQFLLVSAPILGYPKREGDFILDTDGSQMGIGAVLSQIQDGEERVIAYASKALNKAQQRYCTTYIELLAVVTFTKYFKHYLWGRHFLVRTDHASIKWLKNFKEPEGMLARCITVQETYDFSVEYRKSSSHGNADAMSRHPLLRRKCKRLESSDSE